jgi:hypothetical protein
LHHFSNKQKNEMMQNNIFIYALLVISFLWSNIATAQDRYFAHTYTSNVLPKGAIDVEFWHTARIGHLNQYFHAQDQRTEIEFGLGRNLQTSIYFNQYSTRASDGANGTTLAHEVGFSNEWKWKLSDPSVHPVGFALYGEWGVKGGDELELETKLIFDKWIGNSLFAFNGVFEYEKTFDWANNKPKNDDWAAPVQFHLAYQYLVKPKFGVGFEVRNHNEISKDNHWEHSVFFGGPTLNFRNEKWYLLLNYLPQWGNAHLTKTAPFSTVLDKQVSTEFRFIVGISL